MENHVASAKEFRAAAIEQAFEPPELITLPRRVGQPAGFQVRLRRPRVIFFSLMKNPHPGELSIETPEGLRAHSAWAVELLNAVFVAPKLSLTPGPEEIHPNWLTTEETNFLLQWIVGGITVPAPAGEGFRESAAERSAGGGDVPLSPVGDPARAD